jgi:hypothetical protein
VRLTVWSLISVMAARLASKALAVHVFLRATGSAGEAAYPHVRALWSACQDALGMCDAVTSFGLPVALPEEWTDALGSGLLAACKGPGSGIEQAVMRREHDVFCLGVVLAPEPVAGVTWRQLDQRWTSAVAGISPLAALGWARVYLAVLEADHDPGRAKRQGPGGGPAEVAGVSSPSLASVSQAVRTATAVAADARDGWWRRRSATTQGFSVWEASSQNDARVERRLVVVAPRKQEAVLDAWAWTRGDGDLPSFGRYLLHAAKIRYELRVHAGGDALRRLRRQADERVDELLNLLGREDETGNVPASGEQLTAASARLLAVQAGSAGLVHAVTQLREMRRTVEIAAANMAAVLGSDASDSQVADANSGPLAEDLALAAWFSEQLDDDALYLEAARERTLDVATVTTSVVQHRLQQRQESLQQRQEAARRRQEHFNLLQTAVIGAVIVCLTAVQALGYKVPLPGPVQAPVIAALGAITLLLASIVLRLALSSDREPMAWLSYASVGLTVAALAWLADAWISREVFHARAAPGTTGMLAAAGLVVGTLGALISARLRRGQPSGEGPPGKARGRGG